MIGDYSRALKNGKFDIRLALLYIHKHEVWALAQSGYYSKVKHLIDRYEKDGDYLINVEIFSSLILLQRVSPVDGFETILEDKVEF